MNYPASNPPKALYQHAYRCASVLISALTAMLSTTSSAQVAQTTPSGFAPTLPSASAASYYYIAKPGELTMQVNLWGYVKNPGRYEVPSNTDLIQLISYAGGPQEYADLEEVKLTRAVKIGNKIQKKTYILNFEDLDNLDTESLVLYPGDTIFIDSTSWVATRDALVVITAAALIVTAVSQVVIATD